MLKLVLRHFNRKGLPDPRMMQEDNDMIPNPNDILWQTKEIMHTKNKDLLLNIAKKDIFLPSLDNETTCDNLFFLPYSNSVHDYNREQSHNCSQIGRVQISSMCNFYILYSLTTQRSGQGIIQLGMIFT